MNRAVMKLAYLVAAMLVLAPPAQATNIDPTTVQLWDVVYTADGSVLKGVIVEEVPGDSVRIVIVGGTSMVVQVANITRYAKELNPAFAGVAAQTTTAPSSSTSTSTSPRRVATSGLRIGTSPGLAAHSDADASTFFLSARVGWEIALEQWGLTPGAVIDYTPGVGSYGQDGVGIMTNVRAAYRGSSLSPFVGFGLGIDFVGSDSTLGTFMGAGIDLLLHRRIALSGEVKYHRGWADNSYSATMSYVALGMGIEVRL
jgi:hypothetical protein